MKLQRAPQRTYLMVLSNLMYILTLARNCMPMYLEHETGVIKDVCIGI